MHFLLIQNCLSLTKSDPFWTAGRSNTGSSREQCSSPCISISMEMSPALHKCLRVLGQCPEGNYRTCSYLQLHRYPVQSTAGLVLELQHMQGSCSACSNKNFLTILPRLCSRRLCLTREKGFEYWELCCCGDVDDSHSVCGLTPYCHGTNVTHTSDTIRLLQSHWNRFQSSKEHTPTLTSHGKALGLSHLLKRLVD